MPAATFTAGRILSASLASAAREVVRAPSSEARETAFRRFCRVHQHLAAQRRALAPQGPRHISECIDEAFAVVAGGKAFR